MVHGTKVLEVAGWTLTVVSTNAYIQVHVTNIEYFFEGAGTNNENSVRVCHVCQPTAVLDAQEYPWDDPPSSASQYHLMVL